MPMEAIILLTFILKDPVYLLYFGSALCKDKSNKSNGQFLTDVKTLNLSIFDNLSALKTIKWPIFGLGELKTSKWLIFVSAKNIQLTKFVNYQKHSNGQYWQ